jgi:hypothetical protein
MVGATGLIGKAKNKKIKNKKTRRGREERRGG